MIKIDVFIQNKNWKKYISNPSKYLGSKVRYINSSFSFFKNKKINFSILLAGNKEVRALNKKFRNKNNHTDVLSFPFNKKQKKLKENYLGDIIISFNYMNKPKNIKHNQFKERVIKIFIHGFLHLLGFDHKKEKDFKKMLIEEEKIFKTIKKYVI